jgi:hypothetical protein
MKLHHANLKYILILTMPGFLMSCPLLGLGLPEITTVKASLEATATQVKVGQDITLSAKLDVARGYEVQTGQACFAFLYSESTIPGKRPGEPGETVPFRQMKNDLADFPLDPQVNGISPASDSKNVMPLAIATIKNTKTLEATFLIRSVQVGSTKLRANFVCESKEKPGTELYTKYSDIDGIVTVTVTP